MEEGEDEEKAREKGLKRGSKGSVWKEKEARRRERAGEGTRVQQSGAQQAPSEQGQRERKQHGEAGKELEGEGETGVVARCVVSLCSSPWSWRLESGRPPWSWSGHTWAYLTQALGTLGTPITTTWTCGCGPSPSPEIGVGDSDMLQWNARFYEKPKKKKILKYIVVHQSQFY